MMTNNHSSDSPNPSQPLSRLALVCAAADDELTPDTRAALESLRAADPTVDTRIDCERKLRGLVVRSMSEPAHAPASLRAAVENLFENERVGVGPAQTRTRSFWSGRRVWPAVAAAVLLVATVAIVTRSPLGGVFQQTGNAFTAQLVSASNFVVAEHDRCSAFDSHFKRKFNVREEANAPDEVLRLLGDAPPRIALESAGLRFVGLGECSLPGAGSSVHVIYSPTESDQPTLSLFIQQHSANEEMHQDVRYRLPTDAGPPVYVWCDSRLIYYLFSHDSEAAQEVFELLGAPTREQSL